MNERKRRERAKVGRKVDVRLQLDPELLAVLDQAKAATPGWSRTAIITHSIRQAIERDTDTAALETVLIELRKTQAALANVSGELERVKAFLDLRLRQDLLPAESRAQSYEQFVDLFQEEMSERERNRNRNR